MLRAQILAQIQALIATNQIPHIDQIQSTASPATQPPPQLEPNTNQLAEERTSFPEKLNEMFGGDEPKPPVSLYRKLTKMSMMTIIMIILKIYQILIQFPDP